MNAKFIATKLIDTSFKNEYELVNYFKNPEMYQKYLKIIDATDITFEPKLCDEVIFPLKISYCNYPNINFFPYKLPKTKIIQIWDQDKFIFSGTIITEFVRIKLILKPKINKNDNIQLIVEGRIENKKFYIPNDIIYLVLSDFEKIFNKLN